jgi:hypothetical protein
MRHAIQITAQIAAMANSADATTKGRHRNVPAFCRK